MAKQRRRSRFGSSYIGGGRHAHWIVKRNGRVFTFQTDDDGYAFGGRSHDVRPGVGLVEHRGCLGQVIKYVFLTGLILGALLVVLVVLASRR